MSNGFHRALLVLFAGSALSGCGFTVRAGVAPVFDTRGDVRADLIFSVGLGSPTGRTGGTPEAAMSVRLPVLSTDGGRAESGAFSVGGLLRADYGPDGRLGLALERARLTGSSGEDRTLTGIGLRVGVLAPLTSWSSSETFVWRYRRHSSLQAGAELQLRYLWGGPDGRGELALPLTLEYWHL